MKITILALKFTANPFNWCAMLVQGLKGSYIIQSPWSPQKIQEKAFKNAGFCWISSLPEMSSAAVPQSPSIFFTSKNMYIKVLVQLLCGYWWIFYW